MPYMTGLATSASDLLNAVVTAVTDNDWSWDADHNILRKGDICGQLSISGLNLLIQAALDHADGALVTPAPKKVGITDRLGATGNTLLSYPVTYHIFVHHAPDDIIVAVNYQVMWWQWLALGQASGVGAPGNTAWHWGTATSDFSTSNGVTIYADGSLAGSNDGRDFTAGAPFWQSRSTTGIQNSSIYLNFNGHGWWNNPVGIVTTNPNNARATLAVSPLLQTQPNSWNGEAVLTRMHIMAAQPASFWSHIAELPHLRMTRNDNLNDGQIVTLGAERWFIAPVYRKNTTSRDGSTSSNASHSGTIAMAVRYDGP